MPVPSKDDRDVKGAQANGNQDGGQAKSLLPSLALPKGGGALRGIGETFSTNPATGTCSLKIPIATSPGRAGFELGIALSYDSGTGSGAYGIGWSLSTPAITRKTDKGLPRYGEAGDPDVFVLSGSEDLVPVRGAASEPDVLDRGEHRVERYRPRTEGLFARIERWTHRTSGEVHWRVLTRENLLNVYGRSPSARVFDPEHPERVFSWLLEETRDDRGNVARYTYRSEDGAGVDEARGSEASRFAVAADGSRTFLATAQRYLARIQYGNRVPVMDREAPAPDADDDYVFDVVFDYGEHAAPADADADTAPEPERIRSWPVRSDPISSYRAGFEVRTYRLCRRVLMFHRFRELGPGRCLVRSTDFSYDEGPVVTYLTEARQSGYVRRLAPDGTLTGEYDRLTTPPLGLEYARPVVHDVLTPLPRESLEGIPAGVGGRSNVEWVDLDGEGIPGALIPDERAWRFKPNLGGGGLGAAELARSLPSPAELRGGVQQLTDLGGDGNLDLVQYSPPLAGYFERTPERGFTPFTALADLPNIEWRDPNLRFVDLDGDGHPDLLITQDQALVWHRSRAKQGFEAAAFVPRVHDERLGPAIVFSDTTECISLADMSGDGLVDIVRVRNGEVCYWPNLGYGRFGRKVTLDGAPIFDSASDFDPKRVQFADIDGSGTSDIIYVRRDGVRLYFNQAGNGLSAPTRIESLPTVDSLASFRVVDLLGQGTPCLVWSSALPVNQSSPVAYVDLMGGKKPHLLEHVVNNLGGETHIAYAPSTKFYLRDKADGRPWLTRLAFVVHVLERAETVDSIARSKVVTRFAYHHGYFDGHEREFRGFACVEQWDAESFEAARGAGTFSEREDPDPIDPDLNLPPVRTVTWFHTGAWLERERLEIELSREYHQGDPRAPLLPDTRLPAGLSVREAREAARALRGQVLRQEVYAEDGAPESIHPYTVSERDYEVRKLQAAFGDAPAVFFVHSRHTLTLNYERRPDDPRTLDELVLGVDDFGNITRRAQLAYPRRAPGGENPALAEQGRGFAVVQTSDVINRPEEASWFRLGVPWRSETWELGRVPFDRLLEPEAVNTLFERATVAAFGADLVSDEPAADPASNPEHALKRRAAATLTLYARNDQSGPLAEGDLESLALRYDSYALAFPEDVAASLFSDELGRPELADRFAEAGYVEREAAHWAPSGRVLFDASRFFLPVQLTDPFGAVSTARFDEEYAIFVLEARDPLENVMRAEWDFRTLAPRLLTDPNGNQDAVSFDALGRVVALARVGKGEGDTLAEPTTRFEYAQHEWRLRRRPTYARSEARERHLDPTSRRIVSYSYTNGSGGVAMEKGQAEPGPALAVVDGRAVLDSARAARWVGSGRTVLNNKGLPIKKYEPYFSRTHEFEDEPALVEFGVTAVVRYDPLGRLVSTELPDGTLQRTEFDAWVQSSFDGNDLVRGSAWEAAMLDRPPELPTDTEADPVAHSLGVARRLAGSPARSHLDALGRAVVTVADNRERDGDGVPLEPETPESARALLVSRARLDLRGNATALTDPRGVVYATQAHDALGRRYRIDSVDAGSRTTLLDVVGKVVLEATPNGHLIEMRYDRLRRPLDSSVRRGARRWRVRRWVYGESHPEALARNLRGRLFRTFDGAGLLTHERYDFKGNLLERSRALVRARRPVHDELEEAADWSGLPDVERPSGRDPLATDDLSDAVAGALEASSALVERTEHDALNRPTLQTLPDGSVLRSIYNEAGFLESLEGEIVGESTPRTVIRNIDYNARGQRTRVEYSRTERGDAPAFATDLTYDPLTFRLTELTTTRSDNVRLQDLRYYYDAVGNVTALIDLSNHEAVPGHNLVSPHRYFDYDAIYQLIHAEGREFPRGLPGFKPHLNDAQGLRRYTESYRYDSAGNLAERAHRTAIGPGSTQGWHQVFEVENGALSGRAGVRSNRLTATRVSGLLPEAGALARFEYASDAAGNLLALEHLSRLGWTPQNQLGSLERTGLSAFYAYDATGERVRKVVHASGEIVREHIYFGGYEVFREWRAGELVHERETLNVVPAAPRVLLVERETMREGVRLAEPNLRLRFQLGDHLETVGFEVDAAGSAISYEEFLPYGETAVFVQTSEVSQKRYRYTGKEKDEESGLHYHSARYYAPWLGRWCSPDPTEFADGNNLYAYSRANPISFFDPDGKEQEPPPIDLTQYDAIAREVESQYPQITRPSDGYTSFMNGGRLRRNLENATPRGVRRVANDYSRLDATQASYGRAFDRHLALAIGFRESNGLIFSTSRTPVDTYWHSGLDHLYTEATRLNREGYLPDDVFSRMEPGSETETEGGGTSSSAMMLPRDLAITIGAMVAERRTRFMTRAAARGLDTSSLTPRALRIWTALHFGASNGLTYERFVRAARRHRGDSQWMARNFGARTILSFFETHRQYSLNDITRLDQIAPELYEEHTRTTSAFIVAAEAETLERMERAGGIDLQTPRQPIRALDYSCQRP